MSHVLQVNKLNCCVQTQRINIRYLVVFILWMIPRRLNFMYRRFGTLCSIFIGLLVHTTYEDGTDRVLRNFCTKNSDAGELSKKKDYNIHTRRKFEIKNIL
jgi:hypothetical protein